MQMLQKKEPEFLADIKKIHSDLEKILMRMLTN